MDCMGSSETCESLFWEVIGSIHGSHRKGFGVLLFLHVLR